MTGRAWTSCLIALGLIAAGGAAFARVRDEYNAPARGPGSIRQEVDSTLGQPQPREAETTGHVGVILPSDTVEIAARMSGRLDHVYVRLGSRVERGDRIASLDSRALRSELAIAQAQVESLALDVDKRRLELVDAKQRLERRRAGAQLAIPTTSREELASAEIHGQQVELDMKVAGARVVEQRARIEGLLRQVEDSEIRAPYAGVVASRYVDPGAIVTSGTAIVRLLGREQVRLRFLVPERVAAGLRSGTHVGVDIDGLSERFDAIIEQTAPEVDTAARLVFVEARLTVEPESGALAGHIARVYCVNALQLAEPATIAR
jgi:RND family efflux transporter MFP subunit